MRLGRDGALPPESGACTCDCSAAGAGSGPSQQQRARAPNAMTSMPDRCLDSIEYLRRCMMRVNDPTQSGNGVKGATDREAKIQNLSLAKNNQAGH